MPNHRGLDTDLGWQRREFRKLWKALRESNAAKRLQASTIGRGGVTIKGGGSLITKYAAGASAIILGPAFPDATEDGAQMALLDENGLTVLYAYRLPPSVSNPSGASAVYAQGDFITLLSKSSTSQVYVDDTTVQLFSTGSSGVCIGHSTTGSAANCFIDPSNGRIWRSTSSLRYKQDVEDVEVDAAVVLKMQGRTWRDKLEVEKDPETETRHVGFIAEELHDLGLGQFVVYDEAGDPEAISYDRLSVALLAVVKDQERRIAALESADERATDS